MDLTQEQHEKVKNIVMAAQTKSKKKNWMDLTREQHEKIKTIVATAQKKCKKNWIVRLWNYYTTYEKIWLFLICAAGITLGILFPEETQTWLLVVELVAIVGGCSCELLLSKQSKWAFIVSFILYDTTQTIVYFANGYYVSALFEIIFWIPMLFISFFSWEKWQDKDKAVLTKVKQFNYKKEIAIFFIMLAISVAVGAAFTSIGFIAEGLSDWWYLDALANTFSVCNGLFLLFRYKEQWIPWIGVALIEAVMWILSGQYVMLVLSLGYLMNSTYGFIKWTKYIKQHKNDQVQNQKANQEVKTEGNLKQKQV